jgi:hypothetical protein
LTAQCYRQDPLNMIRYPHPSWPHGVPPASALNKLSKTKPRDPNWYRTVKAGIKIQSTTAALIELLSNLQIIHEINDRYTRDLETARIMNCAGLCPPPNASTPPMLLTLGNHAQSQPRRQCRWCTQAGHNSDRCYANDPANLVKHPHSSWVNGEAPDFMKLRYHKCFTQQEALELHSSSIKLRLQTRTMTPHASTSPDAVVQQSAITTLPTLQEDQVTKPSDWLTGISWRRKWFS